MIGGNSQNQLYNKLTLNPNRSTKPNFQALLTFPNNPMYPWVPKTPNCSGAFTNFFIRQNKVLDSWL